MNRVLLVTMLVSTLFGCTVIPERIAQPPIDDLQLDKALSSIKENTGQPVRWGGTVLTVSEKDEKTWIEIRQHQLDDDGAPLQKDDSKGRFLIKTDRLPEKLPSLVGMDITVFGELSGTFEGSVGHDPYLFPIVDAKEHFLWGRETSSVYTVYNPFSYRFGVYPYNYYGHGYYPYPSFYPHITRNWYHLYDFNTGPRYQEGVYYW